METLVLVPRGNVKVTKDYGVRYISYESGVKSFQRQWINPRITYSFSVQGDEAMREYIDNFVDSVHGNFDKFYWVYNGATLTCRLSDSKVEWEHIRGYGGEGCVGYSATIGIEVAKSSE